MNGDPAFRKSLLLPATLISLFVALLLFLLNLGGAAAQDEATGDTAPTGTIPIETPYYLPMVGGPPMGVGEVIPDQYIVVLQPADVRAANGEASSSEMFAAEVAATYGGDILFTYDAAIEGFAAVLPGRAVLSLAQDPNVDYIEPNRTVLLDATQSPATWGIDRIDQRNRPLSNSYSYNFTGAGVHAYIIDTGMLPTHSEIAGRVGNGFTAVSDGRGTVDCNGHGTHVSGTVGGVTYGVAKGVMLHPVRVLNCQGSGSNAGVIAGVNWVAANRVLPAVANMSLGGASSSAVDTAIRNVIAAGVSVVVAAGNSNANACNSSPAREPLAITVGATTSTDARASYSNFGTCLDIFAPGSSITSAWSTGNSAVNTISGTSMASPHVAGAAALYLQSNPSASPATVAAALTGNASINLVTTPGTGSPNRLLFIGFLDGSPQPTSTPTNTSVPPTSVPTNTPTVIPGATNTPVPTATNTPVPPTGGSLLGNGGFESGRSAWTESSARGYVLICNATSCGNTGVAAHAGTWKAWLAGANSEISEVRQTIAIPSGANPVLSFWYWGDSNDWCGYDYGYANLIVNGVTTQLRRYNLCTTSDSNGWVQQSIALAGYGGSTVTLAYRATTDGSYTSSFYVDDVSVSASSASSADVPDNVPFVEPAAPTEPKPDAPAAADMPER